MYTPTLSPLKHFSHTHFPNCHPSGVKRGFIKEEALRLLRTHSSKITERTSCISSPPKWRTSHLVITVRLTVITSISGVNFHCFNQYALYVPVLIYFCMCVLKQKGNRCSVSVKKVAVRPRRVFYRVPQ